jgi:hypothetical protein
VTGLEPEKFPGAAINKIIFLPGIFQTAFGLTGRMQSIKRERREKQ